MKISFVRFLPKQQKELMLREKESAENLQPIIFIIPKSIDSTADATIW